MEVFKRICRFRWRSEYFPFVNDKNVIVAGDCGSGWLMNRTQEGYKFYYNVHTQQSAWEKPAGGQKDHSLLTRDEIQVHIPSLVANFHPCSSFY